MDNGERNTGKPTAHDPQSVIELWTDKGFSLETLSIITKIPVAVLTEIRDDGCSREPVSNIKLTYLMTVIAVFENGSPNVNEQITYP